MYENIFLVLGLLSLVVLIFYHTYFYIKLSFLKVNNPPFNKPISIIICAKNELYNLRRNLPIILAQNYFSFEVIVVNDQSSDETSFFLEELALKNKHLVVVNIDDFVTHTLGKKFALTLGIKTAKYEHLLLTDADCMPNSKNWVQQITSNFNTAEIILGYGPYERKKGLLNKIIRFDTFNIAQQYLAFALSGRTYMGVGRNLAYKKSLFFENKGFASHVHIPSGDDDLFIQEISNDKIVAIDISENSHTTSQVMESWNDWIYQKRRHLSTAPLYKNKFKVLLSFYPLAQLIFFSSVVLLFIFQLDIFYMITLLVFRFLTSYLTYYKIMKQLNVFDLYWLHPLYEFTHLLIQGNFVLLNLFSKPKRWSR